MKSTRPIIVLLSLAVCIASSAQEAGKVSFVEGFHGGLYGHYPMKTYTKYMTDLLDRKSDWKMSIEIEPETWDSVKVVTPAAFERFKDEVVSGKRVEITNPTYAQPYCYNISGESLIRQFEYGIRTLERLFPGVSFSSYAVEEPCFTSCLPQILRGFGMKYASIKNPNTCWGGYAAARGGEIVNWIGPDGSAVLASPRHAIEELGDKVWETKSNGMYASYFEDAAKAGFKHPVGMCYQDAGWVQGYWLEYSNAPVRDVQYVTWKDYFEQVAADVEPEDYVFHQEDVCGGLVWGSQVLQQIAQEVREAENGLTRAEKMGTMAYIANGYRYRQADMDEAWRCLLLSQHHDSWIVPYNGLKGQGTWADWICRKWTVTSDMVARNVISGAARSFMARKRGEKAVGIRVYNTAGQARSEVVSMQVPQIPAGSRITLTDAAGNVQDCWFGLVDGAKKLVFRADAPAFGYSTYSVKWEDGPVTVSKSANVRSIENGMYRIKFDSRKGGTIRSIYDKTRGCKIVDSSDKLAFGELKGYFCEEGAWRSSADESATVTLVEDNQFEKVIRINGTIASQPFHETITLYEGEPRIDFSLTIDWQSSPCIGTFYQTDAYANMERSFYDETGKLNIYFPTTSKGGKLFKDAPFDVCESRLESTRFSNWADIKHNVILDWVDLEGADGNSIAVLSDHTTAYVNGGGMPLGLTLQFCGNGLWGRDYSITGPTSVDFSILPHDGGWDAVEKESRAWNEPLNAVLSIGAACEDRSFADTGDLEISAAYLKGDDVILRLYNATGSGEARDIVVDAGIVSVQEVDLAGNVISEVSLTEKDGAKVFSAAMPQFGFKTYLLKK